MACPLPFAVSELGSLRQGHWRREKIPVHICLELGWLGLHPNVPEINGRKKKHFLKNP